MITSFNLCLVIMTVVHGTVFDYSSGSFTLEIVNYKPPYFSTCMKQLHTTVHFQVPDKKKKCKHSRVNSKFLPWAVL